MQEQVILVSENDEEIGFMEKMEAHQKGLLHRAFSILIFNQKNELLLQRRNLSKYHSPGLWTNTCCSHPRPDESLTEATKRRLMEEMGFVCDIEEIFHFTYHSQLENLYEHEIDHVFIGRYDGEIRINVREVDSYKWMSMEDIQKDLANQPDNYTVWFHILFPKAMEAYQSMIRK